MTTAFFVTSLEMKFRSMATARTVSAKVYGLDRSIVSSEVDQVARPSS